MVLGETYDNRSKSSAGARVAMLTKVKMLNLLFRATYFASRSFSLNSRPS